MTNINLGLMVDAVGPNGLDSIIGFFKEKYVVDDVVVFSKDPLLSNIDSSYGVLSLYYFKFYKGAVVFFTLDDYLEYQDYSLSKDIYLYFDDQSIENIESVDRNMLKNIQMLVTNKTSNQIEIFTLRSPI
jgi:hypothetical protein